VELNTIKNGIPTVEYNNWKTWAEQKVSWYDPLVNGTDPLLNDYYKTNIFKELLKEWQ
jgi:hypothetical protein